MVFRRTAVVLAILLMLGLAVLATGYGVAVAEPRVRTANLALRDWPAGASPIRVAHLTDLHLQWPDMPPARLRRIVARVNALRPDLVVLTGDYVGDKRFAAPGRVEDAVAALARLRAPLGVVAVMGNHDHWNNPVAARAAFAAAGIPLLANEAVRRGPLAVGGLDDGFTGRSNMARTLQALRAVPGARVMIGHSPDDFAALPRDVGLFFAGHTHCGQVRLPLIGAPITFSRFGQRYACGLVDEGGRTLLVSGGLGTSGLPLRFGTRPEIWLVRLGP